MLFLNFYVNLIRDLSFQNIKTDRPVISKGPQHGYVVHINNNPLYYQLQAIRWYVKLLMVFAIVDSLTAV